MPPEEDVVGLIGCEDAFEVMLALLEFRPASYKLGIAIIGCGGLVGVRPIWVGLGVTYGALGCEGAYNDGTETGGWMESDTDPLERLGAIEGAAETVTVANVRSFGGGGGIVSSGCAFRSSATSVLKSP